MLPLSGERVNAKGIISEKLDSLDTIRGSSTLKRGFAHMQKNGVVMDVTNVEQALMFCSYAKEWCCNGCYKC